MSAFTRQTPVRFEHCDPAGLIFYPRFFALVNEVVEDWFAALGHSFKALHETERKGVPTANISGEFIAPVRMGDTLSQSLTVKRLGAASCTLHHRANVGDKTVATFDHVLVFVDLDTMRPEPWPPALHAAMAQYQEQT
jgi:4-hydroxybenzoyl-CoA thioesterase